MVDLSALHRALAGMVLVERTLSDLLGEITSIARTALPGAEATSITLIRGEKAFTAAFDGQLAMDADEMQYERGFGPCLDAGRAGQPFLVRDLRTDERWPDYAGHAVGRGVLSSLSVPLPFQSAVIGALNVYATTPDAFSDSDLVLGQEVAGWIALTVVNAERTARTAQDLADVRAAMASRAVIEQAKGILMERMKVTEDGAFTMLSRVSQLTNIKLREVAEHLVHTGAVPSGR